MAEVGCPYCEERARMTIKYGVEVGPCPLHVPEPDVEWNDHG